MTNPTHGAGHDHGGNELGAIGSQEAVTVVALGVTIGVSLLMFGVMIASRFM